MPTIIEIILPVFGIILVGYAFGKYNIISQGGVNDISKFVFYLAVPALVFTTSAKSLNIESIELGVLIAYYTCNLAIFLAANLLTPIFLGLSNLQAPLFAMGSVFSNVVLVGLPIIQARFGPEGLVALMTIVSIHTLTFFTISNTLIEVRKRSASGFISTFALASKSVLSNPLIIAIACGFSWGFSGSPLPYVFEQFTQLIGQAASPCALFAVGASLAQYNLRGSLRDAWIITTLKLAVAPLIVWLMGRYVLNLSDVWLAVSTLSAAMPIGTNVFILSQRYEIYSQTISSAIILSTFTSILTLTLILLVMS